MKRDRIIIVLGLLSSAVVLAEECPIAGVWKSDEAKTIASMNASGKVADEQRAFLENGFFGKLRLKTTCEEFTTLYEDQRDTVPIKSVTVNGNQLTTTYFDELSGEDVERTITMERGGECYSVPIEHLGFREFFCRVQ